MEEQEGSSWVEEAVATDPGSLADMEELECPRLADADHWGNGEEESLEGVHDGIGEPLEAIVVVIFVLSDSAIENESRCDV